MVNSALIKGDNHHRKDMWTGSIAVGSEQFAVDTKTMLGVGVKVKVRKATENEGVYELREPHSYYGNDFVPKNSGLRAENIYFWNVFSEKTI